MGRWRLPARGTLLRVAVVAALLTTATGVLYSGGWDPPRPAAPASPAPQPTVATWPAPSPSPAHRPVSDGGRLPIPEGMVGVPVALGSPTALAMIHPGDRVDLMLVPDEGEPVPVAQDVPVLAVAPAEAALFLALPPSQARQVVGTTARFAVIVRP